MDINYSRYCDSVGCIQSYNKNTFLNKWHKKWTHKFFERFNDEAERCDVLQSLYYEKEIAKGRHGMDVVGDAKYKDIDTLYNPVKTHKILWWITNIPMHIELWLCCGWKIHYDKEMRQWTYIETYHMINKLCRYGYWPEYKFTWWDKLRFKWITGYDYVGKE